MCTECIKQNLTTKIKIVQTYKTPEGSVFVFDFYLSMHSSSCKSLFCLDLFLSLSSSWLPPPPHPPWGWKTIERERSRRQKYRKLHELPFIETVKSVINTLIYLYTILYFAILIVHFVYMFPSYTRVKIIGLFSCMISERLAKFR